MKEKKSLVYMSLANGGREILAAFSKAGIDPTEALRHEIARRGKKLAANQKKSIKPRAKKNFDRGGFNIR